MAISLIDKTEQSSGEFSGIHFSDHSSADRDMDIIHMSIQSQTGAPLHISHKEDKYFYILTGDFKFYNQQQHWLITAGQAIWVPKGDEHGFVNVSLKSSCLLLVSTPQGHAGFFQAMSELQVPHQHDEVMSVCQRFNQTLILDKG